MELEQTDETGGQAVDRDPGIREKIITAAADHFAHYGYGKTTMGDLAKAIGYSKAYLYKFFPSKLDISREICTNALAEIIAATREGVATGRTSHEKIRLFIRTLVDSNIAMLFNEQRLYEMVASIAVLGKCPSYEAKKAELFTILAGIVQEGRERGEFERKTPLDETCQSILLCVQPFINPLMLEHSLDQVKEGPSLIANLVLRSLAV